MTINDLKTELREMIPEGTMERVLDSLGLALKRTDGIMSSSSGRSYVLSGAGLFLAGALVGGITALLLAPKAGSELRSDIGGKIGNLRNRGEKEKNADTGATSTGRPNATDPLFNDALGG
jgi:hypothetical protein